MLMPFKSVLQKLDLAAAAATTASVSQAIYKRNALIFALSLFNPLRERTLNNTKYIDAGHNSEDLSNLYRKEDGQWWLRFERGDFKNDGSKPDNYDAPIARALTARIDDYLKRYRPVLIRNNPDCTALFPSKAGVKMKHIGTAISSVAKNYIPELLRLGPHALRHIVASDFLRKNPGMYTLLAGLLHDTLGTVLKTYAHGKTESAFAAHQESMAGFFEGI
jgi:integrase